MVHYIFDPEEKEYVEVGRPYPYLPGPNGEPPLSPLEIYKRKREQFFREQECEKQAGEVARKAIEKVIEEAERKAAK